MKVLGFDWDHVNLMKVRHHDLDSEDIEALFMDGDPWVFEHPSDAHRYVALGFVPGGRFVLVVFEQNVETRWVRVVTAYEPTDERWWKRYETKRRKKKGH